MVQETGNIMNGKFRNVTAVEKIQEIIKRRGCFLLLGPPTTLLYLATALTNTVLTDLMVYRTCLVSLQINATECLKLRTNVGTSEASDLEAEVEPHASMTVMTKSLIEGLLPAVVCLFLGPWSDRGGRRPVLSVAFSGYVLAFAILSLMCNWDTSPWYLLLPLIAVHLAGGTSIVRLASTCYVFDTTAEENRTLQLALLETTTFVGNILGGLVGPLIYKNYGYTHVFSTAAFCCGWALAYVYFFIPETVKNASKESINGIFKMSFVKGLLTSASMKRESFHRSIIWLAISVLIVNHMVYCSDILSTQFLFTRTRLNWDVQNYSHLVVVDSILRMTGLFGVLLRNHIPGLTDTLLATIGLVSALGSAITRSLAWQSWHMYLSASVGMFNEVVSPSMRSLISKFASAQDVGQLLSLTALLEVLSILGGAPLYTFIYSRYLPPIYPSPVHLVSTSLFAVLILCVVGIEVLARKSCKSSTYIATAQEEF